MAAAATDSTPSQPSPPEIIRSIHDTDCQSKRQHYLLLLAHGFSTYGSDDLPPRRDRIGNYSHLFDDLEMTRLLLSDDGDLPRRRDCVHRQLFYIITGYWCHPTDPTAMILSN